MMNILLVDDEPILVALMQKVLEREGWGVTVAHSLREAQRAAGTFDVVIADVRLPNGDGRHLKDIHPETPFIAISGFPGETPDLVKPFTPEQLRVKVRALVVKESP